MLSLCFQGLLSLESGVEWLLPVCNIFSLEASVRVLNLGILLRQTGRRLFLLG